MEALSTSQVAEQAGVNIQTVRYYERRGLIPEPPRLASGYRQYARDHVSRIRFIRRAQELGFTLLEIEELLSLHADPQSDRGHVKQRTLAKISEVERRIADLERMRRALEALSDSCDGHGTTRECPILLALDDEHVH